MKDSIVRVSITLLDVDPAIWRRIEVQPSFTLEALHDVIQTVMGWADYHLHHFQFGDVMYGAPTPEDRDMHDGRKIKLSMAPGVVLPRMSAVLGAMASSWRPSPIPGTNVTRNCSNGAAATSTRSNSMSTKSIVASHRSRPARAPAARPRNEPPAESIGGLHRTRTPQPRPRSNSRFAMLLKSVGLCALTQAGRNAD